MSWVCPPPRCASPVVPPLSLPWSRASSTQCFLSPIDCLLAGPISCPALPKSEINAAIGNGSGHGGPLCCPRPVGLWQPGSTVGIPAVPWDARQDVGAEQMLPSLAHILRVPEVLQAPGSGRFIYRKAGSVLPKGLAAAASSCRLCSHLISQLNEGFALN